MAFGSNELRARFCSLSFVTTPSTQRLARIVLSHRLRHQLERLQNRITKPYRIPKGRFEVAIVGLNHDSRIEFTASMEDAIPQCLVVSVLRGQSFMSLRTPGSIETARTINIIEQRTG